MNFTKSLLVFSSRRRLSDNMYMSIFGLTKGYGLFSLEHLMILTARGRHRKPIIDFPGRHNDVAFEGRGSYTLYILLRN